MVAPTSPMLGRYLVRNRVANAGLRVTDAALAAVQRSRAVPIPDDPQRILIGIGGHLGDAVMATAMLADLRAAFPAARLDVIAPSWSAVVFADHPLVGRVHLVDHWKTNRTANSRAAKVAHYVATAARAKRDIAAARYDVAIDSYPFFPNMAGVLWRSAIPVRIGYASGGFGPLYTHALEWVDDREHITEKQRRLSRLLTRGRTLAAHSAYVLAPAPAAAVRRVEALFDPGDRRPIVVLHAGAGSIQKDWPIARWVQLARELLAAGERRVVLTGTGQRDARIAAEISAAVPQCSSLVDQLEWAEFVEVVRRASLVVSADTSAAHVAAACATPHVVLFTGINDAAEFRPLSKVGEVLTQTVPCAPCFRGEGCEAMTCIRGVEPERVLRAGLTMSSKS
jgi:heptosyltransferase-2